MTLKFSDSALAQSRRRALTIQLLLPAGLALFLYFMPPVAGGLRMKIEAAIITILAFESMSIIQSRSVFRKLKELAVEIFPDRLERKGGKFTEKIAFTDITGVRIEDRRAGGIASIRLRVQGRGQLVLHGFEDMELLARSIEEGVSDKSIILRKSQALDWNNPLYTVGGASLMIPVMLLLQRLEDNVYLGISVLFFFVVGIFIAAYRPISRSAGERFSRYELVVGILSMVLALGIAIFMFWL